MGRAGMVFLALFGGARSLRTLGWMRLLLGIGAGLGAWFFDFERGVTRRGAQELDGGNFSEEGERSTTAGAGVGGWLDKYGLGLGMDAEVEADGLAGAYGGGAHEAVVADAGEAFG